jgi:hypothetical protein
LTRFLSAREPPFAEDLSDLADGEPLGHVGKKRLADSEPGQPRAMLA